MKISVKIPRLPKIRDWLHEKTGPPKAAPRVPAVEPDSQVATIGHGRRWEAATTSRLNEENWVDANQRSLNSDLQDFRQTLRSRIALEVARNPLFKGVIETWSKDVVGAHGPGLQVQSDSTEFNEQVEKLWRSWWKMPDGAGQLSGKGKLKLWARQKWYEGDCFEQIISTADKNAFPRLRILSIAPRRIETPFDLLGDFDWVQGIHRNKLGAILEYGVRRGLDDLDIRQLMLDFDRIPAKFMIHIFDTEEASQVRGVPLAATQLQTTSDIRHFDKRILDLMDKSAHFGVVLETDHPDSKYVELNEETDLESSVMTSLPPGYKATQIDPKNPTGNMLDYRNERLRELGRPVGMPQLMVKLDASGHNYSSARFDDRQYWRAIADERADIEEQALNRLVDIIAVEGRFGGREDITAAIPDEVSYTWNWQQPAHIDDSKEATGQEIRLRNQTTTILRELSKVEGGGDVEGHFDQLQRERKMREDRDLPQPEEMVASSAAALETVATNDEEALVEALETLQNG